MTRSMFAVFLTAIVIVLAAVAAPARGDEKADDGILVSAVNGFSWDLYGRLAKDKPDANLFCSPLSVSTALGMTYAGARGETARQMAEVLRVQELGDRAHPAYGRLVAGVGAEKERKGYEVSVANALWGQKGHPWEKAFLDLTASAYQAPFQEMDFGKVEAACKMINDWCAQKTRDKITEIVGKDSINDDTRLVLTNAVYFKGDWQKKFDKERTAVEPFTTPSSATANANMMRQTEVFPYVERDKFQALAMPYVGGDLSMVVFLPKDEKGLSALEGWLTPEKIDETVAALSPTEVEVSFPRFKMTWGVTDLTTTLMKMGMEAAFMSGSANFSGMDGSRKLLVSAVLHKGFVEVNEEGTEAAAATAIVLGGGISMTPVFRADHAFLFFIRDKRTGAILFIGRVTDPTKS